MLIRFLKAIGELAFGRKKLSKVSCLFLLLLYDYLYYVKGAADCLMNDVFIFAFTAFILVVYFLIQID